MSKTSVPQLAKLIDHTLLSPDADDLAYNRLCREATLHGIFSVCVTSQRLEYVKDQLKGSPVKIVTVVGFPHGNVASEVKVFETEWVTERGADEVDMVLLRSAFFSGHKLNVEKDIKAVVKAANRRPVKVILETSALSDVQISELTLVAAENGAAFVKTSTGYCGAGAEVRIVELMREVLQKYGFWGRVEIKASGGIRSTEQALSMINAGATRIGASATLAILGVSQPASSGQY